MNLDNEIKEVKEDLKKRIHAVELTCVSCADPIKKELALIEALEQRVGVLEKALDAAIESLINMCNEYYECEKCPLHPCNTPNGFKNKFLKEAQDEIQQR